MRAELHDPKGDKNWSVHIFDPTEEARSKIYYMLKSVTWYHSFFKSAHPFLQGNEPDWMMIEFWTDDLDKIIRACKEIEKELYIKIQGL